MKMKRVTPTVVLLMALFLFAGPGCKRKNVQNHTALNIPNYNTRLRDNPSATSNNTLRKFKEKWNGKMAKLDQKIKENQQKIEKSGVTNKARLNASITQIKIKRDALQKGINNAGVNLGDKWDDFNQKVNKQYDSLSSAVDNFLKKE